MTSHQYTDTIRRLIVNDRLQVIAWDEPAEHDARSAYVESYWLPILGPTTTLLLRRFADELGPWPRGRIFDTADLAACLGVSNVGNGSAFVRSLGRLLQFDMGKVDDAGSLAVRLSLPTLSPGLVARLPESLRGRHEFKYGRVAS